MIARRGFLGSIASILAGATLDPAEVPWKPTKLISIPKADQLGIAQASYFADEWDQIHFRLEMLTPNRGSLYHVDTCMVQIAMEHARTPNGYLNQADPQVRRMVDYLQHTSHGQFPSRVILRGRAQTRNLGKLLV